MPRMTQRRGPVPVYRGDVQTLDQIRPNFVADRVRAGRIVIVENPDRRISA